MTEFPYHSYLMLTSSFSFSRRDARAVPSELLPYMEEQYLAELAYLSGDFQAVKRYFNSVSKQDPCFLSACTIMLPTAISLEDYHTYDKVWGLLEELQGQVTDPVKKSLVQSVTSAAAVSIMAPALAAPWLHKGEFDAVPMNARPYVLYLYAKYLQSTKRYHEMLAVTKTTLAMIPESRTSALAVYLHLSCASAYAVLQQPEAVRRHLKAALDIGIPAQFYTPFAENLTGLGGIMEQGLQKYYPEALPKIKQLFKKVFPCWVRFHNRHTREHITEILTCREYEIASMADLGMTNDEIAKHLKISVNTVKSALKIIYEKLYIKKRQELKQYLF